MAVVASVILPVYNGARDVERAINSVLAQTFTDYEFIIINDGSTDDSASVLESIRDSRIRLFHQNNVGLSATLNRGIELSRGRYILRQDQDDLSMPTRFMKQVDFMEKYPNCGMLGTCADIWVGDNASIRHHDHPTDEAALHFELLFNNPFVHSSMILRRDSLIIVGGYSTDKSRQPPEDYELWSRLAKQAMIANLSERLVIYREVPTSMSRMGPSPFLEKLVLISSENLAYCLGVRKPTQEMIDLAALTHGALDLVSSSPNLKGMLAVIEQAGLGIKRKNPDSNIEDRMHRSKTRLRQQYFSHRYNIGWIRPVWQAARQIRRRLLIDKSNH